MFFHYTTYCSLCLLTKLMNDMLYYYYLMLQTLSSLFVLESRIAKLFYSRFSLQKKLHYVYDGITSKERMNHLSNNDDINIMINSFYDSLDIFLNDIIGIKKAASALFITLQNNLRIGMGDQLLLGRELLKLDIL